MAEHVEELDLGVTWDPNAPEALLLSGDLGTTVLALNPHHDDLDRRCVVLTWSAVHAACMSDLNDEAIRGHRLYGRGLSKVLWGGVVRDSKTVRALERQNSVHPHHRPLLFEDLMHHIVLLKECVVEVVAMNVAISRFDGTTLDAATSAMKS